MEEEDSMDVDGDRINSEMVSDSEDDNSSDDERKEDELNKKKQVLQQKIEQDKTDYQAYEELIQVLSSLGDLEELRGVREKFSQEYPLSPQLWRSWIEDEKKIATTFEEKKSVNELFERALKDYQSMDIWQEYVLFNIGLTLDGNAVESVRGILERAVETCGLNVASGSLLWDLYREFEETILMSMMKSNQDAKQINSQKQKIANLFFRQLSLPFLDMEKTYEEFQKWLVRENNGELLDTQTLEENYKKALDKLSRVLYFETALASAASEATLPIYEKYLEYEKNPKEGGNELHRIICLYERALTDNPLNADLWSDYLKYTSQCKIVPEDHEAICYRALRNCQTEVKFWCRYLTYLERRGVSKNEITDFFNKALQNPFPTAADYKSLWFAYIYYLRRYLDTISKDDNLWENAVKEIREVIAMAYQNLTECFQLEGDPECKLSLWWARFEAEVVHDYKQFRDIWTDILDSGHGKTSSYWIRYITMEWQYGDSKHMRRLCQRALSAVTDNPKAITNLWLEYESMNGSLDSFLNCERICDERLKKYAVEKRVNEKYEVKKPKRTQNADQKKVKDDVVIQEQNTKSKGTVDVQQQKPKLQGRWTSLTPEKPKKVTPATEITGMQVQHDSSKDDRTIFVSNLEYTVSEEEVKKMLNKVGQIEDFRLVRDFKGRSKGFGYCVFSSKKEAKEALKMDRTPINQRPMFISECDPDKQSRKTGLRFNTGLEKNKLFVKGLPKTMSKEDVEKIFRPFGALKDVRLVTLRNGHSKGLAYVEYEDESSATHALVQTDHMEIEGKPIEVAISNPPQRKNATSLLSDKGEPIASFSLGGGTTDKTDLGLRGRGRTQLSFIPHSVLSAKKPSSSQSDAMDVSEPSPDTNKKVMSNADFRNMLLSKK